VLGAFGTALSFVPDLGDAHVNIASAQAGDARAELRLAQLLRDEGKQAEALESVRRLIASPEIQDDRAKLLIIWTGDLIKAGKPVRAEIMGAAEAAGRDLQRAEGDRGKSLARSLSDRLELFTQRRELTDGGEQRSS
jgi:hypothetical protein